MDLCPAIPPGAGFIGSMTGYIDCQAQMLGSGAWAALAAPGSTLQLVLTGFLTITIALIGYNLLLGRSLSVREGTLAFVKIGAVFALATSWPAYRTLVYDLVTDGPSQLVAEIGPAAGAIGADGTLTQRLDGVDAAMSQLAVLGTGPLPPEAQDSRGVYVAPPPFTGFNAFALGGSRILFELTALGGLGIVRIISGLMLALGPFFIAFLMFESTRSLFEGWVRVLAGAALAAVGVPLALGLELTLVEPWLSNVLARRMADEALPTVATEMFVITCLFAIIVAATLCGCARVARAFRLAPLLRVIPIAVSNEAQVVGAVLGNAKPVVSNRHQTEGGRAAALASVLVSMNRRERAGAVSQAFNSGTAARLPVLSSNDLGAARVPVGRSFARRPTARVSALTTRRDLGT